MNIVKRSKLMAAGSSLVMVMIAVVIMLVLGTGLLALDMQIRNWATRTAAEIGSRTAADAGLTQAVYQMNEKLKSGPWNESNLPGTEDCTLPNCEATYTFVVIGDVNNGYTIESVGRSGHFTRRVNASLRLRGVFDNAIYATSSILLRNNIWVDAPTAGIATDPNGTGTTIKNSAEVDGSVKEESWDLPRIPPPVGGKFTVSQGKIESNVELAPKDSGRYDHIKLKGNTLTIKADDDKHDGSPPVVLYVTGAVTLDTSSLLDIEDDASLIIYLDGDFIIRNSSQVNTDGKKPKQCIIIGCGVSQKFIIENSVDFYGVIYAPFGEFIIENNIEFFGAIVGKRAVLDNHVEFHYDESLSGGFFLNLPVKFVVDRWWQGDEW